MTGKRLQEEVGMSGKHDKIDKKSESNWALKPLVIVHAIPDKHGRQQNKRIRITIIKVLLPINVLFFNFFF